MSKLIYLTSLPKPQSQQQMQQQQGEDVSLYQILSSVARNPLNSLFANQYSAASMNQMVYLEH
jgi:hypothetical protein